MNNLTEKLANTQKASRKLALISEKVINQTLLALAELLEQESTNILAENKKDLAKMSEDNPKYDRLKLTEQRIKDIAGDLRKVSGLEYPVGKILEERKLENELLISKVTVPLGVVGIIYESRPNVTIDVFALCLKSGNACVLKGGSDAFHSNLFFVELIHQVLAKNKLPTEIIYLMPAERSSLEIILNAVAFIDVIIPRGGQELIEFVRQKAKVPVIETGAGIVHTFFDESADLEKGKKIIENAKTRRPAVCNSLDTLLIHSARLADLPELLAPLQEKNVEIFADEPAFIVLKDQYNLLHQAKKEDFGKEFLSLKMSVKTVNSLTEALEHISEYSSKHSEAIISADEQNIEHFLQSVDAAAVYVNTSTAFTDGAQFGMGAEIGISTQKIHARGPMALKELTSYKWLVRGNGQIRS